MEIILKRINELAKIKKERELTPEEISEREILRKQYVEIFRSNFLKQMSNIKVVDENGKDVTPQKLKDEKLKTEGDK